VKEKIAAHSEKEYIFSGEETLSYGLKGKYITNGYSVIFSPGVKSNHRPHSTLSAKAQIPKFQGQIQGIFTCHSHIPSSEIKKLIHQPKFSLSRPGLYTELTPVTPFLVKNTTYRTETLSGSPPSWN
jgi:hypothetical protein